MTLTEELVSALRGVGALIVGDRRAANWFDFSRRGLYGSFIAFLAVTAVNAALPALFGIEGGEGMIARAIGIVLIVYVAQVAASALVLRQMNRLDGLVPYLVADNWATFFVAGATTLIGPWAPIPTDALLLIVGLLVLVIEVNIARLIVTLSVGRIVLFLGAQLIGVLAALMIIGLALPLPPELAEAMDAAAASSRP